jgi:hypothetical protein
LFPLAEEVSDTEVDTASDEEEADAEATASSGAGEAFVSGVAAKTKTTLPLRPMVYKACYLAKW